MKRLLDNPFYHLGNFRQVLDWIAARHADLLSAEEADFICRFPQVPQTARALLVRMVMRCGELFRCSRLAYPEIGCPLAASAALPMDWLDYCARHAMPVAVCYLQWQQAAA